MSLIIATGSNLGDSLGHLSKAKHLISQRYKFVAESRIFRSEAIEYTEQPDFFNQVLEFELPTTSPEQVMQELLEIEKQLGRKREIPKGPRTIDLDIIFWGNKTIQTEQLTIPHPRWHERSFVALPLKELPFFQSLSKWFKIPQSFNNDATPI